MMMVCDFNSKKIKEMLEILERELLGKSYDKLLHDTIIVTCYDNVININKQIGHDTTNIDDK